MKKSSCCAIAVGLLVGLVTGCSSTEVPVGEIHIEPERVELPYPSHTTVRFRWKMLTGLGPGSGDPKVFVHVLDSGGGIARTFDHPFPGEWRADEEEEYSISLYQSVLGPPLTDGTYRLTVGLYDDSGMRWPLLSSGGAVVRTEYQVGELVVDSAAEDVPMFFFSPSWETLEAGSDSQVLGRRWLSEAGAIRVTNLPGGGSLWLHVRIPDPVQTNHELILSEGETEAMVMVSGSCVNTPISVAGSGVHELKLDVGPDDSGVLPEQCEITLTPNYRIVDDGEPLSQRSVGLELLAWSPAP